VGVDPGTTAAVAVLTLEGEPISLHSGKNFSIPDIVSFISQFGSPCIIATDVNPAPHTVDKLSRSFDCKLFVPHTDISVEEKNLLTKTYSFKNSHQRDALAAALKALEYYRAKFSNVDARLQERGLLDYSEFVKYLVLKGYTVERATHNLEQEPEQQEEPEEPEKIIQEPPEEPSLPELHKRIAALTQTVDRVTEYKTELEHQAEILQIELEDARRELRLYDKETKREVLQSKTIKSRESIIRKLRKELQIEKEKNKILFQENEILKEMRALEYSQKALPVKVLPHFSREEIKALDIRYTIRSDDIVYLEDPSGGGTSTARELIKRGIRAVITHERMSHLAEEEFFRARIPVFSEEEVNLKALGNFGVVSKDKFESACIHWKTANEIAEAKIIEQKLQHIIEEYKEKRIKNGTAQVE
jgi:predicted RNase H-like nuclease (RuvC/YqgF family)